MYTASNSRGHYDRKRSKVSWSVDFLARIATVLRNSAAEKRRLWRFPGLAKLIGQEDLAVAEETLENCVISPLGTPDAYARHANDSRLTNWPAGPLVIFGGMVALPLAILFAK